MKPLEKFGEFFIHNLMDRAIDHHRLMEKAHWKAPALQQLQTELRASPEPVKLLVRRCVAQALVIASHDFLFALQESHDLNEGIEVTVGTSNVAAASDGLQGELFGDDGWICRFSEFPESWAEEGYK